MTKLRQITFRPLIWLVLNCALWSMQIANSQTPPIGSGAPAVDGPTTQQIPFSFPSPQASVDPAAGRLNGVPVAEPALIESRPSSRSSIPRRVTVGTMPSSISRSSLEVDPSSAISATLPPAVQAPDQPTVIMAESNSAFPLPSNVVPGSVKFQTETTPPEQVVAPPPASLPSASTAPANPVATAEQRPRILFQPAVPTWDPANGSILKPTVHLADELGTEILATPGGQSGFVSETPLPRQARISIPSNHEPDGRWVPPGLGERFNAFRQRPRKPLVNLFHGIASVLKSRSGPDIGVGIERLPFALFEIDAAQPSNNFRIRFETARGWEFPDRVEYFWGRLNGKGPKTDFETSVDYEDYRIAFEVGGARFSATTEIPLRFIDPDVIANTGGMGDMVITTKTVMIDGDSLQLTQVLRNQMPTGSVKRGLGNGHVSMEPGFVARYNWDQQTIIHNELKLWFPLGAEPGFSGPVLRYGFGLANAWYDSDSFAVIRTFELVGWSVLTGQKTVGTQLPPVTNPQSIDGENIINFYPGLRFVSERNSKLYELGISGGASLTERHWYSNVLRVELRWTF